MVKLSPQKQGTPGSNQTCLWRFFTIRPPGHGTLTMNLAAEANIQAGEHYRVFMTDRCLGIQWLAYKYLQGKTHVHSAAPFHPSTARFAVGRLADIAKHQEYLYRRVLH
jgi:hypothetical protein